MGTRVTWAKAARGKVALGLIALAFLLRIMVPAGYMPAAGQGFAITLCTGTGLVSAWVDRDGNVHKQKPGGSTVDHPCAFASLSAALPVPQDGGLIVASPPAVATPPSGLAVVSVGRGLAAPPPPATGPPSLA